MTNIIQVISRSKGQVSAEYLQMLPLKTPTFNHMVYFLIDLALFCMSGLFHMHKKRQHVQQ